VLADRVSRRGGTRPLLNGRDPKQALAELAAVRNPIYSQAQIHIRSMPQPHNATVDSILEALGR